MSTTSIDLSVGGICIRSGGPLRSGDQVAVSMRLDDTGEEARIDGAVRWCEAGAAGIQFTGILPRNTARIALFLATASRIEATAASSTLRLPRAGQHDAFSPRDRMDDS